MDEQCWSLQPREVLRAELFRFARRVQWIREQQQSIGDRGIIRSQQSRLPTSIRVAAEYHQIRRDLTHRFYGMLQSVTIARGCARKWRTGGTHLTIGKIAAQNVKPGAGELFRHRT
jgi:hypothetical protein